MKTILLLLFFSLFFCLKAQDCPEEQWLSFVNQTQIDEFAINYPNCTELNSNVVFTDSYESDDEPINNLQAFNNIELISGELRFEELVELENLNGFENLQTIDGNLYVSQSPFIFNLNGLNNLQTINGNFELWGEFTTFEGVENLETI